MNIFAIGDLHLPGGEDKPMDVFSDKWANHQEQIKRAWQSSVKEEDLVLVPGDFSWAMQLEKTREDFLYLDALPGRKIMIRGNHDYWWNSLAKVRAFLPASVKALQNDSFSFENVHIAGTRGWSCPGTANFTQDDKKIYEREVGRLALSLKPVSKLQGLKIVMLHYPPFNDKHEKSGFSELIKEASIDIAVYGHLHGFACKNAFEGERDGTSYHLVSADHVRFAPKWIATI
ncbi:metallophosphoesterase [Christensenellaceae bacterium OttesenSCG-928-M15]|nr:metallophosphoesterase [Christensenellaceae bacterium OttesenSCG-928-M15]